MKKQRGQALILVLIALAVGSLLIFPTLSYVRMGLAQTRISEELLLQQYAADAAAEHATCRLLHEPGFADSLNEANPSASWEIEVNGITVTINVTFAPLEMFTYRTLPGIYVDYTIPAGHYLELKVIAPGWAVGDDDLWFAYDTTAQPSVLYVPTETETMNFYWHNNPMPPVGDTVMQHPLPLDTAPPSAETLYNYDTDRNAFLGRLVQKGGQVPHETDPVLYQEWRTTTPFAEDFHIQGEVGLLHWWGMKDFNYDKTGHAIFYLRDYKGHGSAYTEIGELETIESTWLKAFDFRATCRGSTIEGNLELHGDTVKIVSWQIK